MEVSFIAHIVFHYCILLQIFKGGCATINMTHTVGQNN